MKVQLSNKLDYVWLIGFALLFILPIFFSEQTWGFHHWIFLPPLAKIAYTIILVGIVTHKYWLHSFFPDATNTRLFVFQNMKYVLVIIWGAMLYNFPIYKDLYGDSFLFEPYLHQIATHVPEHLQNALTSFDFRPATSRQFSLALLTLVSKTLGINYQSTFRWSGIFLGLLFSLIWFFQITKHAIRNRNAWLIMLMVFTAPLTLTFYGHNDNYALVYVALLVWLMAFINVVYSTNKNGIWFLLIGLVLIIKIHPLFLLLLPAWILILIHKRAPDSIIHLKLMNWQGLFFYLGIPIFTAGAYLYFFIFKDYNDLRILQNITDFDRLFLPLISPEAPLDKYNLFSIAHLLDYVNILIGWSPVAIILFFTLKPKNIQTEPVTLILGFTLFLFTAFMFMINPLITMPMDWDLFSIPAIIWMVMIFNFAKQNPDQIMSTVRLTTFVSIAVILSSFILVNHSAPALSKRIETIGVHVYKTYYEHSPRIIHSGIAIGTPNIDDYLDRKNQLITDLLPYAQAPNDIKFAMFHTDNGILYRRDKHDLKKALFHFTKAEKYAPNYWLNTEQLMHLHSELKNEMDALSYAQKLYKNNYPSPEKSRVNMVTQEIKFSQLDAARTHCKVFLIEYPSSIELQNLHSMIHAKTQIQQQE